MLAWVTNLSVGLGLTPNLTTFMNHIDVRKIRFAIKGWGDVYDVRTLELNKFMIRLKNGNPIYQSLGPLEKSITSLISHV